MVPDPTDIVLERGPPSNSERNAASIRTNTSEMMAISCRHAPRQWAYSQDTLAALDDAATAEAADAKGKAQRYFKGKGKSSTPPYHKGKGQTADPNLPDADIFG